MERLRKPEWLKADSLGSRKTREITRLLRRLNLNTVCESAKCPNRGECFERGTATLMILGDHCTRNCTFCAVEKATSNLPAPDPMEPERVAETARTLKLRHVVLTMVTRDDLDDGGAEHIAKVIRALRDNKGMTIEMLVSDLQGNADALRTVVDSNPDILNHNVETIERLYPKVRPMADFYRSLNLLKRVKEISPDMLTKSGFMVGLGETREEVIGLLRTLREHDVDIVTIGQYMMPSPRHYQVREYVSPEVFEHYRTEGEKMGFLMVFSAPLVRSSYMAEKIFDRMETTIDIYVEEIEGRRYADRKSLAGNLK